MGYSETSTSLWILLRTSVSQTLVIFVVIRRRQTLMLWLLGGVGDQDCETIGHKGTRPRESLEKVNGADSLQNSQGLETAQHQIFLSPHREKH